MTHLWEIDRPSCGADDGGRGLNECESFEELRDAIHALDPDLNHVYRFEWWDYSHPVNDHLFVAGEDRSGQDFYVYLILPGKNYLIAFQCPITHEQEPEVLEWLRGPRVLGALRGVWAPILGEAT